jgi:hypothetical protein
MRHAEYVGGFVHGRRVPPSREWKRRNDAFRSIPANRACSACPPVLRLRLRKPNTHHLTYRCGACDVGFSYWTHLAEHWVEVPACGETRRRLGGEYDRDLKTLCAFHHWLFEVFFRALRDLAIARHRSRAELPSRRRWTWAYVAVWWLLYLAAPGAAVLFLLVRA